MKNILAVAIAVIFVVGCATENKMTAVSIGMTKDEVVKAIGQPNSNFSQGNSETLKYELSETGDSALSSRAESNYVRLINGRVVSFGSLPKPLAVYSKSDMQQRVLKMWGNTSRDVLQSSTFTAEERYFILQREVVDVIMTPPEKRNSCSTGIVISTKPVVPAPVSGSKSEIWVVEECSLRRAFQATLDATQLEYIKKNPVLTEPAL